MARTSNTTLVVTLGRKTHRALIEGAGESIEHHRVDDRLVANAVPGPRARQQVGRAGHRLHSSGDDDVGLAGANHQVSQIDGLKSRETDLINGGGVHAHGDARLGSGLTCGDLTLAGLDDLAHEYRVDAGGVDAGRIKHALDGRAAKVLSAQGGESPRELANCSTTSSDDDTTRHDHSLASLPTGTTCNDRRFVRRHRRRHVSKKWTRCHGRCH